MSSRGHQYCTWSVHGVVIGGDGEFNWPSVQQMFITGGVWYSSCSVQEVA